MAADVASVLPQGANIPGKLIFLVLLLSYVSQCSHGTFESKTLIYKIKLSLFFSCVVSSQYEAFLPSVRFGMVAKKMHKTHHVSNN